MATGKEIIFKVNPTVITSTEVDPLIHSRSLQIPFAFVIENLNGIIIENFEKYVAFQAFYVNFSKITTDSTHDFSLSYNKLDLKKCQAQDFSSDSYVQTAIDNNSLRNGYCLDQKNQNIGGGWQNLWNYYVNITLVVCNNQTSNIVCASQNDINTFLINNDLQFTIYYEDMMLDSKNNNILQKYMKNDHTRIVSNICKTNKYYLQEVTVVTDNGWIMFSPFNDTTQIFKERLTDFYYFDKNNVGNTKNGNFDFCISFNFFASENSLIIYRVYVKVQDILAQLGGILKIVTIFFEGLFYLLYSYKQEEILVRNMFGIKTLKFSSINEMISRAKIKTTSNFQRHQIKTTNNFQRNNQDSIMTENEIEDI